MKKQADCFSDGYLSIEFQSVGNSDDVLETVLTMLPVNYTLFSFFRYCYFLAQYTLF